MKRLQKYLDDQKLTQVAFADDLGVTQPTVHGWLHGLCVPSVPMLKKISIFTGISIDELLDHQTPAKPAGIGARKGRRGSRRNAIAQA